MIAIGLWMSASTSTPSRTLTDMDVDELLLRAWEAVKKAGLPEPVQGVALKEAVRYLRDEQAEASSRPGAGGRSKAKRNGVQRGQKTRQGDPADAVQTVDESTFFSQLANESGVDEHDLRDILNFTADGRVQVSPPTKDLGRSAAEQAKSVLALVASARSVGLGERPVDAEAVRREVERKRCYQPNNFASKHLGPMKGFNAGSTKKEILVTSRWLDDFKAAVATVQGPTGADDE